MPKNFRPITTYNVFQSPTYGTGARAITAGGSATSQAWNLIEVAQNGYFSIEYTVSGSGTVALTYTVCSTSGGTFFTPVGGGSIITGLTAGTGGISFFPEPYPFIKIVATETGGASSATVTLKLNIQ